MEVDDAAPGTDVGGGLPPAIPVMGSAAVAAGIAAGNINVAQRMDTAETLEMSETTKASQEQHAATLLRLEIERRARTMIVPVDVDTIKRRLRELGEPVTLFGEGPADRRDRLKRVLAEAEVTTAAASGTLAATVGTIGGVAAAGAGPSAAAVGAVPITAVASVVVDGAGKALVVGPDGTPLELFYTPASQALQQARADMAAHSFAAARTRLSAGRDVASSEAKVLAEDVAAAKLLRRVSHLEPTLSQAADERPLSAVAASGDGSFMATGSWGSSVKVWDGGTSELRCAFRGHTDRVVSLAWQPQAAGGGGCRVFASGSVDGSARLWRLPDPAAVGVPLSNAKRPRRAMTAAGRGAGGGDAAMVDDGVGGSDATTAVSDATASEWLDSGVEAVAVFMGHTQRLSHIAFHPCGRYLATASYDKTWRLWDVERPDEALLVQEGHAREVYGLAMHVDGSLVASGDLGGVMRLWDVRSGKSLMATQAHAKQVLSLDFSPNGHHLVSSSDDHTAVVWELRQQRQLYTLPAHTSLIPRAKFAPTTGEYLATCSYDGSMKVWSARDWSLIASYRAHEGKVVGLDIFPDETRLVTACFDRTLRVWTPPASTTAARA